MKNANKPTLSLTDNTELTIHTCTTSRTDKPMIRLTDVTEVTLRQDTGYTITNHGAISWFGDDEKHEERFVMKEGKMEVAVRTADDIISITATSQKSAELINKLLGKTIADYDKYYRNSKPSRITVREMLKQAWKSGIIYIDNPHGSNIAHVFIYNNPIPLISASGAPVMKHAQDYLEHHCDSEIFDDIEESINASKYKDFKRLMNGEYQFQLPYVRYPSILTDTESIFYADRPFDRVLEEMSELAQMMLRYKRLCASKCSEKRKQDLMYDINEATAGVLSTITHMIMIYGNKEEIQHHMDRKLSRLAHRVREEIESNNQDSTENT